MNEYARRVELCVAHCAQWGVSVTFEEAPVEDARFRRGPESAHLWWADEPSERRVIFSGDRLRPASYDGLSILHELHHLLHGVEPSESDEHGSELVALGWYTARYLRLPSRAWWSLFYVPYYGTDGRLLADAEPWYESSPSERRRRIERSFTVAVARGVLTPAGIPTFRRPAPP